MRILIAAAALMLTAAVPQPAAAVEYPWCAYYGDSHGGINCGFVSYEQCRAAISGNGGYCQPNPYFAAPRGRR
jgi:uncharacterized protein DUF3551